MKHYPEEHKQAVIRKLLESGLSLGQFAKLESINLSTLYSWRDKYLKVGSSLAESCIAGNQTQAQQRKQLARAKSRP